MGKIIEAGQLPENEKVYLKKDFLGWRVVEPYKDMETNKINYFNLLLGGKRNLIILIFIMFLAGMFYFGFKEIIYDYKLVADSPCSFCKDCQEQTREVLNQLNKKAWNFNFTIFNQSIIKDN